MENVTILFDDDHLDSLLEKRNRWDILQPTIKCITYYAYFPCMCQLRMTKGDQQTRGFQAPRGIEILTPGPGLYL